MTAIMPARHRCWRPGYGRDTDSHLLLVFSDMPELGEASMVEHLALAPAIEAAGARNIVYWPDDASLLRQIARPYCQTCFDTADALIKALETDSIALSARQTSSWKGSHGSAAHKVSHILSKDCGYKTRALPRRRGCFPCCLTCFFHLLMNTKY